jgi:hypothetical protein
MENITPIREPATPFYSETGMILAILLLAYADAALRLIYG